jgi:O-antigen ligase
MRSLILFLCAAQITAGGILFALAWHDRAMPRIEEIDLSLGALVLLAASGLSIMALALARFEWTRWLGLLLASVLPLLYLVWEIGLRPPPQI